MKAIIASVCLGIVAITGSGCATSSPKKADQPWGTKGQGESLEVTYQAGNQVLPLRRESWFGKYRSVAPRHYAKHHIPKEATSAWVGVQWKHNFDVYFTRPGKNGTLEIYRFTYGLFDIEWPPTLLYRIDQEGRVTYRGKI